MNFIIKIYSLILGLFVFNQVVQAATIWPTRTSSMCCDSANDRPNIWECSGPYANWKTTKKDNRCVWVKNYNWDTTIWCYLRCK